MARMTLDIPDSMRARLDALKTTSEASSITEVVRRAVQIYGVVLEATQNGERVIVEGADGERRELVILI